MTGTPLTIAEALAHARAQGLDRLDAQILLARALGQPRSWLLAHDHDPMPAEPAARFADGCIRRARGEPLAYILGSKEFFGMDLAVSPDVLIPRPDTETIVDWALSLIPKVPPGAARDGQAAQPRPGDPFKVLDLGTGSGAIALAIQRQRPGAAVTAVDASAAALRVAQGNARRLGLPVRFLLGNWLAPVEGEHFDLIVSNPPYIAEGDPHLAALTHEPTCALTSGPDGLDDIRRIVHKAPEHLSDGGWLLLEHGYDQATVVSQLLRDRGFSDVSTRFDLGEQARCTGARMGG